jgi:hypothetical protein
MSIQNAVIGPKIIRATAQSWFGRDLHTLPPEFLNIKGFIYEKNTITHRKGRHGERTEMQVRQAFLFF